VPILLKPNLLWVAPTIKDKQTHGLEWKQGYLNNMIKIYNIEKIIPFMNSPWTAQCDWLHRLLLFPSPLVRIKLYFVF
jgi:hypothetical protein